MGLTVCGAQGLAISVTPSQKIDPEFNHFSHIQGSHSGPSIHTQAITINTSVLPVSFLPLLLFFFLASQREPILVCMQSLPACDSNPLLSMR